MELNASSKRRNAMVAFERSQKGNLATRKRCQLVILLISLQLFENGCHDDIGGHWKMSDDGLEWIPSEDTDEDGKREVATSKKNPRNPESNLTVKQKKEMDESEFDTLD